RPPIQLTPRTRYYWKVIIWGESETAESDIAWFETAKLDEDWKAEWITPDWDDKNQHPILYKDFQLSTSVISARAYICGLGLYHFELNGQKIGDEYLTPYCNAYDQWIQYQTFDITDSLTVGSNQLSIMLGNGWYKGRYGADRGVADFYGDRFALICEIHLNLESGDTLTLNSDSTWKTYPSPIIASDIFDGEIFDARMTNDLAALDEAFGVKAIDIDMSLLQARRSLPVRIMEEIKPIALIETPAGETVLDMGQIMTGWLRFKTSAPEGAKIYL